MGVPNHPAVRPRRFARSLACAVFAIAWLTGGRAVFAHAVFMTCIQHRVTAVVGPANIDIRIELTFFEIRSMSERRHMDADGDGTITSAEVEAYISRIAGSLAGGVHLSVAGRPVDVMPLYRPEVDLLGVDQVAPAHHVLRLFYFARTPAGLVPGDDLAIEDGLWRDVARIGSLEAAGEGGFRMLAAASVDSPLASDTPGKPLVLSSRCTAVPSGVSRPPGVAATKGRMAEVAMSAPKGIHAEPSVRLDWRVALLLAALVLGGRRRCTR